MKSYDLLMAVSKRRIVKKIDRVDMWAVRIPFTRTIKFAYGSRSVGDYLMLKIHKDEGVYGISGKG